MSGRLAKLNRWQLLAIRNPASSYRYVRGTGLKCLSWSERRLLALGAWNLLFRTRPIADICAPRSIGPMATLVLRYEPDPADEVGKLWFELQADRLSGAAFFWSDLSELPGIIEKLGSYPFGEPATWKWGFNTKEGPEAVLALRIMQTRSDGALEASVSLSDLHDTSQRLTAKLQPDYVSLDVLRQQLRAMHTQRTGEAMLSGT